MNKKTFSSILIIVVFIAIVFLFVSGTGEVNNLEDIKGVRIGGENIKVDLAISPSEHKRGLSGKSNLPENTGMLFIFEQPGKYLFWMKDMNFAIDIIWLGEDQRIVYIKRDARPESYLETYGPREGDGKAKYVLEVISGFSDKNNLKVGDRIYFTY